MCSHTLTRDSRNVSCNYLCECMQNYILAQKMFPRTFHISTHASTQVNTRKEHIGQQITFHAGNKSNTELMQVSSHVLRKVTLSGDKSWKVCGVSHTTGAIWHPHGITHLSISLSACYITIIMHFI